MDNSNNTKVVPNPGSTEAIVAGCKCPVIDNRRGRGLYEDSNGVAQYVVREDCPLHGEQVGGGRNNGS